MYISSAAQQNIYLIFNHLFKGWVIKLRHCTPTAALDLNYKSSSRWFEERAE